MAGEQKAKAKGKKIGQNRRQPSKMRYTAEGRRDKNKSRKMLAYARRFNLGPGTEMDKAFPGWSYREGYGFVKL